MMARVFAGVALPTAVAIPAALAVLVLRLAPVGEALLGTAQHGLVVILIACTAWAVIRAMRVLEMKLLSQHRVDVADNLEARRVHTQTRVLSRTLMALVSLVAAAIILISIPGLRQVGAGLLASAGAAGLVAGFAAQPVLGNLIAGLQLALAQPIRIDDVVIVEGEWGRIEEITSTYVVVKVWDQRRLIVPLRWFIETPFQNWTRTQADILGAVMLWLDYRTPMDELRRAFDEACKRSEHWDGKVAVAQVVETGEWSIQVRLLVSAADAGAAFTLRCEIREAVIDFLARHHEQALPVLRTRNASESAPSSPSATGGGGGGGTGRTPARDA